MNLSCRRRAVRSQRGIALGLGSVLLLTGLPMTGAQAAAPAASSSAPSANVGAAVTYASETPTQRYIRHVYGSLFARQPDAGGLAGWTAALNSGTPRVTVANAITGSTEYRSTLIKAAYQRYLGRLPDTNGLTGWLAAMRKGMTISTIESGFVASTEFYAKAGGTDAAWVRKLYHDVLERTAGAGEVTYWTQQLRGGARRAKVAAGFLLSTERLTTVMEARYQHLLGRSLDAAAKSKWISYLKAGGRDEVVIGNIIATLEYWQRADVMHHLTLTPTSGTITSGGSLAVRAQGFDAYNYALGDVTEASKFSVSGTPCPITTWHTWATCSPTDVGDHVVTGETVWTNGIVKGTVTMHVNAAGPLAFSAYGWGANDNGQLGDGTNFLRGEIQRIGLDTHWESVATGGAHTVAIKSDGTLWVTGSNRFGQLGDGRHADRSIAVQIGTGTTWASVTAGTEQTLAIKDDGSLWAWGNNEFGQLGVGGTSTADRTAPVRVGTDTWSSVASGNGHTAAVRTDGTAWTWGDNDYGQLGDGSATPEVEGTARSAPGQVGTATDWASVAVGAAHTVAVKTDGTLWAWGANGYGQLGLGDETRVARSTPVQVGTGTNWTAAAAGFWDTRAVTTGGTLWAWGDNEYGQLGLGDEVDRLAPAQVGTGTSWAYVAAGSNHTAAVTSGGTLWVWGADMDSSSFTNANTPLRVGTGTTWARVAAGGGFTVALRP